MTTMMVMMMTMMVMMMMMMMVMMLMVVMLMKQHCGRDRVRTAGQAPFIAQAESGLRRWCGGRGRMPGNEAGGRRWRVCGKHPRIVFPDSVLLPHVVNFNVFF